MIYRICKLANKLDKKSHNDLADRLEFVASIMDRKQRSPISHQNLVHKFRGLIEMLNSEYPENRAYAKSKLEEYEPVFRKFAPELFQVEMDI